MPTPSKRRPTPTHIAVIGAGIAGITAARTLMQAGHRVSVFEKSRGAGGRMSTRRTEFGSFDHGAQFLTVRDARFEKALKATAAPIAPWSAAVVRVLDTVGHAMATDETSQVDRWVATPGMNSLVKHWCAPIEAGLGGSAVHMHTLVSRLEPDALNPLQWQLRTEGPDGALQVHGGFDRVLLAIPHQQADALLRASGQGLNWLNTLKSVEVEPCWTLMLAFPQAGAADGFGPRWHAARSDHHRIQWLARETSKPGRESVERWTVQASAAWSSEHLEDDEERVKAKLLRGFAEITGIRVAPSHAAVHRWRYSRTHTPLGQPFMWDDQLHIGLCGDWCLGHRVEDAFVSGLELALHIA
jgi:renalase